LESTANGVEDTRPPPSAKQLAIKRAELVEALACDGYLIPRRRCNPAV
jgi:hypothetical protein